MRFPPTVTSPRADSTPSNAASAGKSAQGMPRTAAKKRAAFKTSAPPAARTQPASGSANSGSASPSHMAESVCGARTAGSIAENAPLSATMSAFPARPCKNRAAPSCTEQKESPPPPHRPPSAGFIFGTDESSRMGLLPMKVFDEVVRAERRSLRAYPP